MKTIADKSIAIEPIKNSIVIEPTKNSASFSLVKIESLYGFIGPAQLLVERKEVG